MNHAPLRLLQLASRASTGASAAALPCVVSSFGTKAWAAQQNQSTQQAWWWGAATMAALGLGAGASSVIPSTLADSSVQTHQKCSAAAKATALQASPHPPPTLSAASAITAAEPSKPLPMFSREEVAKHKRKEDRIWVTHKDGVYDITEFVEMHPGGASKIMMAAGGSVDPFWAMYQQHLKSDVSNLLKEYRIGTLEGWTKAAGNIVNVAEVWQAEPERHVALMKRSEKPCNAETPSNILAANLITNNDIFYVRNHLPVPQVDTEHWTLHVRGEGLRNLDISLAFLKSAFKRYSVTATVQCAGNRRNEMKEVKEVKGLGWDAGAIGTAVWTGVRLCDVLAAAGLHQEDSCVSHIQFVGADKDPITGETYGASIPVEWALSTDRDVLLALEMNGEPLPLDHGAPLRVIIPGVVGARHVKWLTHVIASDKESSSHWQQKDYKGFGPSTDWDTVEWDSAPAIQEPPITSAITEPMLGTVLPKGTSEVTVRGYAWSGGGREVIRVDVSADGGASWTTADLRKVPQKRGHAWAWTLWETSLPLPKGHTGEVKLVCKAVDASYNTQPDSVDGIWNLRGLINNAWYRMSVEVAA